MTPALANLPGWRYNGQAVRRNPIDMAPTQARIKRSVVNFRTTAGEHNDLRNAAAALQVSVSDLVRDAVAARVAAIHQAPMPTL